MTSKTTSLWRLASYINGFPFKPDDFGSSGMPVIRIRQLVNSTAELDLTEHDVPEPHRVDDGDLIFSWSGSLAVRTWDRGPAWLNQHLFKVLPASGVSKEWLRWALQASILHFEGLMHGSAMTHITLDMLKQVKLDVPNLDEQRRIAEFLDAEIAQIDRLTAARQAQVTTLGQLWGSRLAATIDEQASVYGWIPLRRVASSVEQGWSPQCDDVVAEPNEWAVLKTSSVSSGEFAPLEHKRLPQGVEHDPRYRVADGDILMTRGSGSPNHVGMAAEAKTEGRRLLLCDLLYRVRLAPEWSPRFVALALRSHPVRSLMELLFRGQSGQTIKLRAEDVRSVEVPAVPVSMQAELAAELAAEHVAILSVVRSIETSMALLAERRQAIITAAVTGQIDVTTARGVSA